MPACLSAAACRHLSCDRNWFQSLPASLAAATSLTRLDLSSWVALSQHDVDATLARLPHLRRLVYQGGWTETAAEVLRHLAAVAPRLEVPLGGHGRRLARRPRALVAGFGSRGSGLAYLHSFQEGDDSSGDDGDEQEEEEGGGLQEAGERQ